MRRFMRTLRTQRTPVLDVEVQLTSFPPEVREQILQHLHSTTMETSSRSPNGSKEGTPQIHGSKISAAEFQAGLVQQALMMAERPSDLDLSFWRSVQALGRAAAKSSDYIHLFVKLFEAAKAIEDPTLRQKMIYSVGKYIYRQKKVRMDPVNEVEFLDALVAHNRPFRALQLWQSRVGREDVQGYDEYWTEVGALYHLEAGLLQRANNIALKSPETLRLAVHLIDSWSRQLSRNKNPEECVRWLQHWTQVVLQTGQSDPAMMAQSARALVAAKQWPLVADLFQLIELPQPSLADAFQSAINAKCSEQDFLPFFAVIAEKCPPLATDPNVAAMLALYLARSGDFEGALGVLEDLTQHTDVPLPFQRALYRAFEPSNLLQQARSLLTKKLVAEKESI